MELIILWDIDHTLIENSGVSKEIYAAAFSSLAGCVPTGPARTEGRTDRLIMREMFLRDELPVPEWPVIEDALAQAGHDRLGDLRSRGTALPGVHEVLKAASLRSGWVSSVLTGNIAANAHVKLSAFGLDSLLDLSVGSYGADAELRPELVAVARQRIQRLRGVPADVPAVLVGDTPRDVEAALSTDSGIVAVASGVHSPEELAAAGAHEILPDLLDTKEVLSVLESFAGHAKRPRTSLDRPRMR
ncbi:phosphoglycolate phosphatase-like HAD superfamily hydrolase [Streptomyces griseochromogenes]|uniref:Haloacid dehalogenase n=1 Tax=Streptomyces griseochromogenes TaxID=68214 RepID=A0A1B1B911_9ACTN|nr:haloacid dehalogenase-like hydrolase [Streptomyces griseochromogenes]ANP55320.1 haloacid dehalogenase [Streptomyces griseochromogenes]MBP2054457.1 phosphoglycolate phosphatase-like HAD superfamily hydrolase [Streptomyces griseochromogenes]